jgi:type IV pilus assembly protein PilC
MALGRKAPTAKATSGSKTFSYTAVSLSGERVKNTMIAPSAQSVVSALKREGWVPLEVTEMKSTAMSSDVFAFITGGGVKLKWSARAEFSRRLSQMLRAGISVPKSLVAIAEDAPAPVAAMCTQMAEKVMAGQSLADAMEEHRRAFDEVTVAYIRAGEESGELVETTARLSVMLAKRAALASKIKGVSAYPKMVGGSITILVGGILTFLVPMYAKIYAGFGATLPAPTRALMWFSKHLFPLAIRKMHVGSIALFVPIPEPLHFLSFVFYIAVGVFIFMRKTKGDLEVGRKLDKIKFRLPLMGKLYHLQGLQRWAMTLAGSYSSGVNLSRGLDLAARATGSRWHLWVAPKLVEAVRTGRTISSELSLHRSLYPPSVRTMLATGEDTGEPDTMLNSVADSLDSDIDSLVAGLSAKIEVALLLVLGGVVGGLLLVLYLPILDLATTVSNGLNKS